MFPKSIWEEMSKEKQEYFANLSREKLINRWHTQEGKTIIKRLIEINMKYGKSHSYLDFIGTVKDEVGKKPPKIDLRGLNLSGFSSIINDEIFSFDFSNCLLTYSNFEGSFFNYSNFNNSDILYSNFKDSHLEGCNFMNTNLTLSDFSYSSLENANLKNAWISSVTFKESNLGYVKFNSKTDFSNINTEAFEGSTNPLFIDFVKRKQFLKNFRQHSISNKILYYIWLVISDCGQSFIRWFSWSVFISIFFGFLYSLFNESFIISSGRELTSYSYYYYSIITFSTLGYGDITPKDLFGEILVTIEVIIGYIMLGGLLSIFADKFIPKK